MEIFCGRVSSKIFIKIHEMEKREKNENEMKKKSTANYIFSTDSLCIFIDFHVFFYAVLSWSSQFEQVANVNHLEYNGNRPNQGEWRTEKKHQRNSIWFAKMAHKIWTLETLNAEWLIWSNEQFVYFFVFGLDR